MEEIHLKQVVFLRVRISLMEIITLGMGRTYQSLFPTPYSDKVRLLAESSFGTWVIAHSARDFSAIKISHQKLRIYS